MTIEQLFGTLQQSVVDIWREHLKTSKYSAHMAMDEYYKEMPELIDTLIENYMGRYGKVLSYESTLTPSNFDGPVGYLTALREMVGQTYETINPSELKSDLDAILSFIDSTVYKLRELNESEVEYTLEEGAGEYNQRLLESCKGCKKDKEEEEVLGKKKKPHPKYSIIDKEEEETEVKESVLGRKKNPHKKYSIIDTEEECETNRHIGESLSDFLSRTM